MRGMLLTCAALALAACSPNSAEQENADDFAARIGSEQSATSGQAASDMPNTAQARPPEGAIVTDLQKLGDISRVDLGPRDGGCTFVENGTEMLMAAGMNDPAMGGKAVIRVGNGLVLLDSGPGGLDTIRAGTTFTGEGVEVTVRPAGGEGGSRDARIWSKDASGKVQKFSGQWICT